MTHNSDFFKRHRPPDPPRKPQSTELLFEFCRWRDHTRRRCELRQLHEPDGVEAQFYRNEDFHHSRGFDRTMSRLRTPREMAIAWAQKWRKDIEAGGA